MGEHGKRSGKVYLVGAGPGDAGLITVKGMRCLQEADVIVYDRLASPRLLQMSRQDARRIYVGKLPDRHAMKQPEINQLLVTLAQEGLSVCRLKGGDPCVFGRAAEEAALLKAHHIPYEVVPGVTSAVAVPAYAGIPVTHRDWASSFCVITGHETPDKLEARVEWEKLSAAADTLLFLMGVANISTIAEQLMRCGRSADTPVALIRWGTRSEQETIVATLATVVDEVARTGFSSPAIIVVGDVVRVREQMAWVEQLPLFGQRILVTRTREQSQSFVRMIEKAGGEPYELPVIATVMPDSEEDNQLIEQTMTRLSDYQWLVLTSENGVRFWMEHMKRNRADFRRLAQTRIVAVGPKTAEAMSDFGIVPDLVAEQFSQEGVWDIMGPHIQKGEKVLLARGNLARKWLAEQLREAGVHTDELTTYQTILPQYEDAHILEMFEEGGIQIVPFTSSSIVTNLLQLLKQLGAEDPVQLVNRARIVCIGNVTAETAREAGIRVDAVAESSTIEGLFDTIVSLVNDRCDITTAVKS
ncbi:uroporphyrinogen-III C-methyltransferase [Paenibacillus sp. SC116]|uniref:uroporphyrinogen-III C-methyltransferase n=1 Tax=Paenibacillus sp. SC116 TaxID=2968986 RepID=UPI00215B09F6|nr:uroporphyrinogen-III C-methyltransferase [Paenibacillus sp. SC116]